MSKFNSISERLSNLERDGGYETLDDGSKFRFQHNGILIYVAAIKHGRDAGRKAILSDFTPEEQREIAAYAKWTPDPELHGQISIVTCQLAREILGRGGNAR